MVSQVLVTDGTTIVFSDGTPTNTTNADITLDSLAADGVRCSKELDRGAAARAEWFSVTLVVDGFTTATPVVGETVDLYLITSVDGTQATRDADHPGTDVAGSVNDLPDFRYIVSAVVNSTTNTDEFAATALVRIPNRYIGFAVHNNTAAHTMAAGDHAIYMVPHIPEI